MLSLTLNLLPTPLHIFPFPHLFNKRHKPSPVLWLKQMWVHPQERKRTHLPLARIPVYIQSRRPQDLLVRTVIISRQCILPGKRDPCFLSGQCYLSNQFLGGAQCILRLLVIPHLDTCKVEHGVMTGEHTGDREVPVTETGVVVPSREFGGMGPGPIMPVDAGYLDGDFDGVVSKDVRGGLYYPFAMVEEQLGVPREKEFAKRTIPSTTFFTKEVCIFGPVVVVARIGWASVAPLGFANCFSCCFQATYHVLRHGGKKCKFYVLL
ncbi:hypothetical protein OROHE_017867 [Orobanche hederae]